MPGFDEELLSAYLDGELSAAESARVERMLAEQPESRQLLEELRSIKASLERLPRARLPHDFADQVLRQAEREILAAPGRDEGHSRASGNGVGVQSDKNVDRADRVERLSGFSWQRLRRPVLWASLTLAAGLLLMVLDRGGLPVAAKKQVAMAPAEAPRRDDGEIGARPAGAPELRRPLAREELPQSAVGGMAGARQSGTKPSEDQPEFGLPESHEKKPLAAPEGMVRDSKSGAAGAKSTSARSEDESLDRPALAPIRESMLEKDARTRVLTSQVAERQAQLTADQTLVVWCDVAPNTKYNERFRELLSSNSIAWDDGEEPADKEAMTDRLSADADDQAEGERKKASLAGKPVNGPQAPKAKRGATEADAEELRDADYEQLGLLLQRRANRQDKARPQKAEELAIESNAELVIVEASEPQIEAVLAELDRDDDVFKTVDVDPAAEAPRQQSFERYRRGLSKLSESSKETFSQRRQKLAKKVEEVPSAPAPAKTDPGAKEAKQNSLGYAYRLHLRSAQSANLAQDRKLDEAKQMTDQVEHNRVQVLFVLHPLEDVEPAAAAAPAEPSKPKDD